MPEPMIAVEYDRWVEEGDNRAGFAGYRAHKTFFFTHEEFDTWLLDMSHLMTGERKYMILKNVYVAFVEDKLDLSNVLRELYIKQKNRDRQRALEIAEREAAEAAEKVARLKAL